MTSLQAAERPLSSTYDAALVDLDGVVYVGAGAVAGAPEALAQAKRAGMRVAFVTNNASRPPSVVADHLSELGFAAGVHDVVTSAQAAATLVAKRVAAGSAVLVVGGVGLDEALQDHGLRPVRSIDECPAAVVQGFAPEVGWKDLAEGTLAVLQGLPWVASNMDRTIPTVRGIAPGNGTLVAAITAATGVLPEVAGKPELPLHEEAVRRTGARNPLVIGDRLDTDIDSANRAGVASLLVLTGVCTPRELILCPPGLRPTYISESLASGLNAQHPAPVRRGDCWTCGGWCVTRSGGTGDDSSGLSLSGSGEPIDGLRALCAMAWSVDDADERGTANACADALAQWQW